jgi:hypothetical protein
MGYTREDGVGSKKGRSRGSTTSHGQHLAACYSLPLLLLLLGRQLAINFFHPAELDGDLAF